MPKTKVEITDRQELIQFLMDNNYHTDDAKYHAINLEYLNGLSDFELQRLYKIHK